LKALHYHQSFSHGVVDAHNHQATQALSV
jgi:hypothetical protein